MQSSFFVSIEIQIVKCDVTIYNHFEGCKAALNFNVYGLTILRMSTDKYCSAILPRMQHRRK